MRGRLLLQRRGRMVRLKAKGEDLSEIVKQFHSEYRVSIQALYKDWRNRGTWIGDVARLEDPLLVDEMVEGLKQVITDAWFMYSNSKNESVRIAALKLARDTYTDTIEILQSIGRIERMPEIKKFAFKWGWDEPTKSTNQIPTT